MKRKRIAVVSLVVLIVLLTAYVVSSSINFIPKGTDQERMLALLEQNDCMRCHTPGAQAPFYAGWPLIGEMVKNDMQRGLRHFDLTQTRLALEEGMPINAVILNRIENSITKNTMPLHPYKMVHWNSNLSKAERAVAADWVRTARVVLYGNNPAAEAFRNEPVRPIDDNLPVDPRKVLLGNKMFNDTRLSIDNTLSCASCHNLQTGGVDNKQFSDGVNGNVGDINAPTVYNSVYNHVQFWDGRAGNLAEQAAGPPENPVEMGAHSWDDICAKLNADKELVAEFVAVYPEGITKVSVTDAIAEYEKTLITPGSRFDRYLKGEQNVLNENELRGYEAFKKYDCHTCHAGVNMGGATFEYMGLEKDYFADRGSVAKADFGRFNITGNELDKHRLKTPTLRNVELTAPYYHDGTIATLDEAVGKMVHYQTRHRAIPDEDAADIVAFLHTLTAPGLKEDTF